MSRFKRHLVVLILYIVLLSFATQFLKASNFFQFQDYFFPTLAVAILLTVIVPFFEKWAAFPLLSIWWLAYAVLWFMTGASLTTSGITNFIIEFVLLSLGVILAKKANASFQELEHTLDRLVFAGFTGRALMLDDAAEEIKTELTRSRRYHRPLSLVVIEPDPSTLQDEFQPTLKEIQQHMAKRYVMAHIAEIIDQEARRTDLIIKQDKPDRFIILCPETQSSSTNTLIRRIVEKARDKTGIMVGFGVASFPEEALTFEELVNKADTKLVKPGAYTITEPKQPAQIK